MNQKITLLLVACLLGFAISVNATEQKPNFVENKGQIADGKGNLQPDVLFKAKLGDVTLFFKKDAIVYLFTKFETIPTEQSKEARLKKEEMRARMLETKPMLYRMDLKFIDANPTATVTASGEQKEVSNYYLAHCPKGITGVRHFEKITYKNIYPGIDIVYFFTDKGLKYDIVINPGGNISQIQMKYEGASHVSVNENGQAEITYVDNRKIIEDTPVAYYQDDQATKVEVKYFVDANGNIQFIAPGLGTGKTFIIDPSVTWATYFHNTASANSSWTNPEFDSNGNLFKAVQTYDEFFPMANPGGSAWYDATSTVMMEIVVQKFNASRTLVWSTFYGGNQYNQLAGCTDYGKSLAVDNAGNVYVAGSTNVGTTVFPTLDAGGTSFYQDQTRCYGETAFFLKFNNSGVRQWATIFTHETASTSGTMIRVNGITCDGTNLFFTGQQYDWTPANTIPLRNPAGGAHYQTSIIGSQDVFVGKFNATQTLVWCTYVHSTTTTNTAFGQGLDVSCDASGNFYMIGRESGANSHHYLLNLAGSYYQGTKGGSDDLIITKFNSSLTAVWSTYYGGDGMDICSTIEPDGLGNMYIMGRNTPSTNFPTMSPGAGGLCQTTKSNAVCDGFLIRFNSSCARTWATYLGANVPTPGSDENHFSGIAFNTSNNHVFISGYTKSVLMTTVNKAGSYNQAANAGDYDMFFYEFDNGGIVQWASYYGGSLAEYDYNGRMGSFANGCGLQMHKTINAVTQNIPTVDPGGGAWYQSSTTFTYNDFLLELTDMTGSALAVSNTVAASANPICAGASVTFTSTATNGGVTPTYQWYVNGGAVGANSSTYTYSPAAGDQIYCVLTSSESCTTGNPATSNTITITVSAVSTAPTSISAAPATLCSGSPTTLTVSGGSLGTGANWVWYDGACGGTPLGSGTGTTFVVNPTVSTTYYVLAAGACNTTTCVSTPVTVSTNSTAPTSILATANPVCAGQPATLTVNGGSLGTGASWNWYTGGCGTSFISSGTTLNVSPSSSTTYFVLASGSCNTTTCASLLLDVTTVNASAGTNQTICTGATTTLTATGGGTYLWSAASQTTASIVVTPAVTTTYTVTVTVGSCTGTSSVVVNVTSAANASITPAGPYCVADPAVNLSAVDPGGTWTGTGITNAANGTFNPATAGVGTHQIIYTISGSCGDADTINIQVVSQSNASITPAGPYCTNNPAVNLTAATSGGIWTGTGITSTSLGTFNPSIAGAGIHAVIYTISGACGNADTVYITVNASPSIVATGTGESCAGENDGSVTTNTTGGTTPYTYIWNLASSSGATLTNVNPGTYNVTVTSANGCSSTGSAVVSASTVSCETVIPDIFVPNIFSPNADGNNDVLLVYGKGIKELTLVIYDRWGEKVFETTDQNKGWDGTFRSKPMDPAVFAYYLKATLVNDEAVERKGNITLVR
ncbi:MAG: gliding motility-associated C-terminal domain-containing protein [Bacteroidota bacterium]